MNALTTLRQYVHVVILSAEMWFRETLTDSFVLFVSLIQPLIIGLLGLWMLQGRGGEYAIYVVVGSGMAGLWSNLVFLGGSTLMAERWNSTLENVVGAPTPLPILLLGKNIASVLLSLSGMVVGYILASILLNYPLTIVHPLLFALSVLFMVISFVSFGLLISPLFVLSRAVESFRNAMEFPVYMLAGFLFPIALLPDWTTPISYLLAPYWAARALHSASQGTASPDEILLCCAIMLGLSLVYLVFARSLFGIVLRKAQVEGTLSLD